MENKKKIFIVILILLVGLGIFAFTRPSRVLNVEDPVGKLAYKKVDGERVLVTITFSEEIKNILGWIRIDSKTYQKYYYSSGIEIIEIENLSGNKSKVTVKVERDLFASAEESKEEKNEEEKTNENKTPAVPLNENTTGSVVVVVPPVVVPPVVPEVILVVDVMYSNNLITNQDVVVVLKTNNKVNLIAGFNKINEYEFTRTYSKNVNESIVITDVNGKSITRKILITNIDKTPIVVTVDYNDSIITKNNINLNTVTITTSEKPHVANTSWTKVDDTTYEYTFNSNKSLNFFVEDKAGNITNEIVDVTSILELKENSVSSGSMNSTGTKIDSFQNFNIEFNNDLEIKYSGSRDDDILDNIFTIEQFYVINPIDCNDTNEYQKGGTTKNHDWYRGMLYINNKKQGADGDENQDASWNFDILANDKVANQENNMNIVNAEILNAIKTPGNDVCVRTKITVTQNGESKSFFLSPINYKDEGQTINADSVIVSSSAYNIFNSDVKPLNMVLENNNIVSEEVLSDIVIEENNINNDFLIDIVIEDVKTNTIIGTDEKAEFNVNTDVIIVVDDINLILE